MRKSLMSSLLVALLLLAVVLLSACGGGEPAETTPPETSAPAASAPPVSTPVSEPVAPPTSGGSTVVTPAVDRITPDALAEYKIVYPASADAETVAEAERLAAAILEATGVTLPVVPDNLAIGEPVPEGGKEIRVGITNRDGDLSYLRVNDYRIETDGEALLLAAQSAKTLKAAIDVYLELMVSAEGLGVPASPYWYQAAYPVETLRIGGVDISRYVIVRDSENAMTAIFLRDKITEMTGYVLPIVTNLHAESVYEIVIGNIARAGFVAPEAGIYAVERVGTKVMLGGAGTYAGYFAAIDFMENTLVYDESKVGETLAINVTKTQAEHSTGGLYTLNLPEELGSMEGKYDISYSTDTVLRRFFLTRAELPEEVTVLERFKLEDYPFSQRNEIFVSPDGDDANPGTKEAPLATLSTALAKMTNRKGGVIWMMGGNHTINTTVTISAAHSGMATSPLFIKAYNDEEVILSSSMQLDVSAGKWRVIDEFSNADVWDRIPEEARYNIMYTTLADQGLTPSDIPEISTSGAPLMYVGGEEYVLARFPNETIDNYDLLYFTHAYDTGTVTSRDGSDLYFLWVDRATKAGWDLKYNVGWEIRVLNEKDNKNDKESHWDYGEEILSWVNTGDIWYYGSTFEGWEFGYYNLALYTEGKYWAHNEEGKQYNPNVDDVPYLGMPKSNGYYSLKSMTYNSWGCKTSTNSSAGRNTFYLFNAIEALDAPGEWFYDKNTGYLYLYPEEEHVDLTASGAAISNPTAFHLMSLGGASNVIFDGLTIDGTSGYGMALTNCDSVIVQNCTFRNTKNCAIAMTNCFNTAVIYSDFSMGYSTLVNMSGATAPNSLRPSNNVVQNCFFHNPAPLKQTAIAWGGCRTVISHNYFNNMTTQGSTAVECIIEYNRFEGGSKDITDGGMVYAGGSTNRANHFRYNLFHMFNATHNAVYNDTMGSANYAYGNICSTLHSTSDHNKPWYSSTGWAHVYYGNISVLRNPIECAEANASSSMESDNNVFAKKTQGDMLNESALFYYYFGDEHAAVANRAWKPVDMNGNPQKLVNLTTGVIGSQPTLSQSLAGHWWLGIKQGDVNRYLNTVDQDAWTDRAPEFINMMHGTKMLMEVWEQAKAGFTDYHIKHFYMPWYLSGKSYTFTDVAEGTVITIPAYRYLDGSYDASATVATVIEVPERTFTVEGDFTLTFEEIAAMERARRAPMYSVVMNNVILGGTPIFEKDRSGQFVIPEDAVVDRPSIITDSAESYQGHIATTVKTQNFMSYLYDDIMPDAKDSFYYEITEEGWEMIEVAAALDAELSVDLQVIKELKNASIYVPIKAGFTEWFDYSAYFNEVYPNFYD